jgi:hypothetical protein
MQLRKGGSMLLLPVMGLISTVLLAYGRLGRQDQEKSKRLEQQAKKAKMATVQMKLMLKIPREEGRADRYPTKIRSA